VVTGNREPLHSCAGDYDGDGATDLAVVRAQLPLLQRCGRSEVDPHGRGTPVPADYDGDGKETCGLREGSGRTFNYDTVPWPARCVPVRDRVVTPMRSITDGDGKTDRSAYQNGIWHFTNSTGPAEDIDTVV
jgi:hypothetical protein